MERLLGENTLDWVSPPLMDPLKMRQRPGTAFIPFSSLYLQRMHGQWGNPFDAADPFAFSTDPDAPFRPGAAKRFGLQFPRHSAGIQGLIPVITSTGTVFSTGAWIMRPVPGVRCNQAELENTVLTVIRKLVTPEAFKELQAKEDHLHPADLLQHRLGVLQDVIDRKLARNGKLP